MENKLFAINWTSENPYQREIDLFFWSLKIIEAFDNNELTKKQIEKLNSIGFNWGYAREKLMENKEFQFWKKEGK